ncbi:MAG TPA: ASCH domain-containing protein [Kiritimatiellia bacterium]|nr:ASCH domain-containing protein [Kiritimatiellia bacterium]HMO97876.1 ASCH domain-containing protein [Kiritimatiellia bacterium]HMP95604.1 ASCH domain-containing protein [Kiritimatiellia bacterium]
MKATQALLISIRPKFVDAIFAGTKTVELRRVKPRLQRGDLVVVYASGKTKGIVGAFEVAGVTIASPGGIWRRHNGESGLCKAEYDRYFEGTNVGYAIQIGNTWKLPSPILLGTLRKRRSGFRPPQSYHYWPIEEILRVGGCTLSLELGKYCDLNELGR